MGLMHHHHDDPSGISIEHHMAPVLYHSHPADCVRRSSLAEQELAAITTPTGRHLYGVCCKLFVTVTDWQWLPCITHPWTTFIMFQTADYAHFAMKPMFRTALDQLCNVSLLGF
jgi:hypothetical protein